MKKLLALSLLTVFALSACGSDSHKKLMKDQIEWIEEITEVLEEAADGGSIDDAVEKIKELDEEGNELKGRLESLSGDSRLSDRDATKYSEQTNVALERFEGAVARLVISGRASPELIEILDNMSTFTVTR